MVSHGRPTGRGLQRRLSQPDEDGGTDPGRYAADLSTAVTRHHSVISPGKKMLNRQPGPGKTCLARQQVTKVLISILPIHPSKPARVTAIKDDRHVSCPQAY